jgi:hypothetical protein
MKHRHLAVILSSFGAVCLAVLGLGLRSLTIGIAHPNYHYSGSRFDAVALAKDERITVTYSSSGCFHYFTHTLTLEGGKALHLVAIDNGSGWFHGESLSQIASPIGVTTLSERERRGWDQLMTYYRSQFDRSWSTTTVRIHAEYFKSGVKVGEESIVTTNPVEAYLRDYDERTDLYEERDPWITPDMISFRIFERHAQKG